MRAKVLTPKSLHLTNFVPDRKVSASNPALRLYLTVSRQCKKDRATLKVLNKNVNLRLENKEYII